MNLFEKCEVYFSIVKDYRDERKVTYKLTYILFMVMIGIICGCTDIEMMIEVLDARIEVIKKYIDIERIPCKSTFTTILRKLDKTYVEICIIGIMKNVVGRKLEVEKNKERKEIAIDGKAIRSTNNHGDAEKALQIVTALDVNEYILEAQTEIREKSNEIVAGRELLELIELKNAVVTMDAMHTQKETVKKIKEKGGEYIIQVKDNQKGLKNEIKPYFDKKLGIEENEEDYDTYTTIEKNGGRIEKRTCKVLKDMEYLKGKTEEWEGIKKVFCIERNIERNGKETREKSYYITSLNESAEKIMTYARNHWKIESYHWILDVDFKEDDCRTANEEAQVILNTFRKLSIKIHKDYIKKSNPKRKTIISSTRSCLLSDEKLENFLDSVFG